MPTLLEELDFIDYHPSNDELHGGALSSLPTSIPASFCVQCLTLDDGHPPLLGNFAAALVGQRAQTAQKTP